MVSRVLTKLFGGGAAPPFTQFALPIKLWNSTCTTISLWLNTNFYTILNKHISVVNNKLAKQVWPLQCKLAIPTNFYGHPAFPRVRTMYYIIINFISPTRVCVVYVVKEVTSFRGLGQLMGVARKRTRVRALQTSRKKAV